jgi:F-type H+/Na+-transporting ATPase subunit alpha
VILQALTAGHFDSIALERMDAAQHALLEATSQISSDVRERWLANSKLSNADRAAVTQVVGAALLTFQKVA